MIQEGDIEATSALPEPAAGTAARIAGAALAYAAPVLAASWLLAGVRETFVGAGADPLMAALGEAPAVALLMVYSVGWAVREFGVTTSLRQRLAMGLLAATLLASATVIGRAFESGGRWRAVFAPLATGPGAVLVLSLALAVVLPLVRERADDSA